MLKCEPLPLKSSFICMPPYPPPRSITFIGSTFHPISEKRRLKGTRQQTTGQQESIIISVKKLSSPACHSVIHACPISFPESSGPLASGWSPGEMLWIINQWSHCNSFAFHLHCFLLQRSYRKKKIINYKTQNLSR